MTPAPQRFFSGYSQSRRFGIDDRQCRRKFGIWKVVIGYDHVDTYSPGMLHDGIRANTRIHADDKGHTFRGSTIDHFGPHTIAVAHAVRHKEIGGSTGKIESLLQDDDGGCAVDIIVAIEQDFFFTLDRLLQAGGSSIHVLQQEWIVHVLQLRI